MTAQRFKTQETAQIEVYGQMNEFKVLMKNLSMTGALLVALDNTKDNIPREGELLRMTVHLSTLKRQRTLNAEVIWRKGLGLGVRFIDSQTVFEKLMNKL